MQSFTAVLLQAEGGIQEGLDCCVWCSDSGMKWMDSCRRITTAVKCLPRTPTGLKKERGTKNQLLAHVTVKKEKPSPLRTWVPLPRVPHPLFSGSPPCPPSPCLCKHHSVELFAVKLLFLCSLKPEKLCEEKNKLFFRSSKLINGNKLICEIF